MTEDLWLDGNGIAGLLAEVFGAEVTARRARLRLLRRHERRSARTAPTAAPGVVLRCPACGDVAIRIAQLPDRNVVQVRGAWAFELPRR